MTKTSATPLYGCWKLLVSLGRWIAIPSPLIGTATFDVCSPHCLSALSSEVRIRLSLELGRVPHASGVADGDMDGDDDVPNRDLCQ
ncbi:MAG: hypothetical protein LBI61_01630 [Puniceicoccales bacterium]|nr:hypothetical protein [Puniceicoccales bacterium]